MRLKTLTLMLMLIGPAVLAGPAAAQQPAKPVVVDVPNAPGGKVVLVPRDQMKAGPGVKTVRVPHPIRAAMGDPAKDDKTIVPPKSWDWTRGKDGRQVKLPMLGNDRYGDCYYVAPVKVFMIFQWLRGGGQMDVDLQKLINRYLQLSRGDNGLSDAQVFPEMRAGVVGPNGPHKALDLMIVPATDKKALDLTGWCFGPHMFTFSVYSNFQQNVGPNVLFTGSSGREVGGHAILFSGRTEEGYRVGETWGIQPGFRAADSWIYSVDPEYISVFSLEWFDDKGYAPNGLHYTTLAPLWNSLGGSVPVVSPFPPPVDPIPDPKPKPDPDPVPGTKGFTGTMTYKDGVLVSVAPGAAPLPASIDRGAMIGVIKAKGQAAFPGIKAVGGTDLDGLWAAIADALIKWFLSNREVGLAPPPRPAPAAGFALAW